MKLPFFHEHEPSHERTTSERVEPPWQSLVLVCTSCKGSRKGPDARGIRKGLKHRLGKPKHLRVSECDCLGVCPDDAITLCITKSGECAPELRLVRSEAELDELARRLSER